MIKYSVVICAFNEEKHIATSVKSIIEQNFNSESYEVIIVDNSSEDSTFDITKSLITSSLQNAPRITLLKIKHVGLSASRNTAIQYCKGDYIAFVDGDAKADIEWLSNIDKAVSNGTPETEVFSGAVHNLNEDSFISNFIYQSHVKSSMDASNGSKLVGANMVFNRKVFDAVKFLDGMRRGDESSLLARYKLTNPCSKELHVEKAIVLNDYPDNLKEWINISYTEGRMRAIINRDILNHSKLKLFAETVIRFTFMVSLIFLCLSPFFAERGGELAVGCALILLLRLCRARKYFKNGLINTFSNFRYLAILSPLVGLILFVCRDLGILNNTLEIMTEPKVELSESDSTVLDKVLVD
jgi:glycosyltransferase involved in cell wall biosynthesis